MMKEPPWHAKLKWFAVWCDTLAYAHDVYPEEISRHRASLQAQGFRVAGPFGSHAEAEGAAVRALMRGRSRN
jgi:hypothetical protein